MQSWIKKSGTRASKQKSWLFRGWFVVPKSRQIQTVSKLFASEPFVPEWELNSVPPSKIDAAGKWLHKGQFDGVFSGLPEWGKRLDEASGVLPSRETSWNRGFPTSWWSGVSESAWHVSDKSASQHPPLQMVAISDLVIFWHRQNATGNEAGNHAKRIRIWEICKFKNGYSFGRLSNSTLTIEWSLVNSIKVIP